ncbi:hypothetical protein BVC93_13075 [Mycobacterium sp. MS1601]|uniref:PucR family transcriptional regulator n=1 Tax=Mycobacterium sp. MS1601 TaxID=1936029 RepID=UPI0009795F00|nr:PucR family transcriptional regulator [Mycobacterium sp. MS1601]AQA03196.1 hypothetical protein BVC93_13075 [Mycobacterium sp. MS1601]
MSDRGRRELEQLVDDLADRLQRSVVVDDPTIRLIYSSRHFGDEDQQRIRAVLQHDVGGAATAHILGCGVEGWSAPGPIPARDDLGMARRWCGPLRWRGLFLGVLMVIDAQATLTGQDMIYIADCCADIAALLYREAAPGGGLRDAAVADAVSDDASRRTRGVAVLRDDDTFRDSGACTVSTVRVLGAVDTIRVEAVLRSVLDILSRVRTATVAYAVHGAHATVVQMGSSADAASTQALAAAVCERTATTVGSRTVCGIGGPRHDLGEAWKAMRDSEIAIEAATRVLSLGDVCRHEELGPYTILMRLPTAELTAELLPAPLVALLAADSGGALTQTLAAYLEHAGNSPRTAQALHIHRTSLYYRLGRIRELTGVDLDDGRTRLSLQLGLAVLPLLGA